MIKNLTQFRIGLIMSIIELFIFITCAISGRFNSTIFICMVFWISWTIYFWNQRGKKCYLKIIPLKKDHIEIGDLVEEKGFALSGIASGITTCIVPDGQEYSTSANPIQLVIVTDDKLKLGDSYVDYHKKEIMPYSAGEILELTTLIGAIEDLYMKKVVMLQKDMPQEFIQSVIDGKTKGGDTIIVRKNKVFKERPFFKNNLIIGCLLIFVCALLIDVFISIYAIFDKDNSIGKTITIIIGAAAIAPIFYQSVKFIFKHYKHHKTISNEN